MFTGFNPNDMIFLLVCFIPGFLSLCFAAYLVPARSRSDFDKVAMSIALGFAIFSVTVILGRILRPSGTDQVFYIIIPWLLILPAGVILSIVQSRSWILGIFKRLRLSRRIVGVSCWNRILSKDEVNWVLLHLRNGTSYIGWVEAFSDIPPHEIVIHPIRMTSSDGIIKESFHFDDRLYVMADNVVCLESLSVKPESEV